MFKKLGFIFKEFTIPARFIKKSIKEKKDFYKTLSENRAKKDNRHSSPILPGTSKEEYEKRLKGIMLHFSIVGIFTLYSLFYTFFGEGFLNYFSSLLITGFFLFSYVIISFKVYVAMEYYNDWGNRFHRKRLSFRSFIGRAIKSPHLFFPRIIK
tara:strand:+ start:482 stop:943 length:462 start_codon:yes stop_codon:yes gene_type:complete